MRILHLNMWCHRPAVLPWVILAFAAINVIFLGGKRRAFGGFVAVLRKDFGNISLTELNWIGDSYSALAYMSSSLSIALIFRFDRRYALFQMIGSIFIFVSCITSSMVPNPHWLFLTHTVFHGIGSSLIISTVGLVVNEHFDHKHPYHILATTLVSGGSLAAIVFVSFFALLIEQFGWRMAFVVLGILYFAVTSSAALFFRKKEDNEELAGKMSKFRCDVISPRQVPLMVLWFFDRVITSVVTYGLLLNLTDYVYRSQTSLVKSTILTTLFAAGEGSTYLFGTILTLLTKDLFKNKLGYILLGTSAIAWLTLLTMEYSKHLKTFSKILCFICGFTLGPSNTFLFPAGEELTGLPGHMAYPFSLGGMGVGMLLSPLLTAWIAEVFMYNWFFLVQSFLIFTKVVLLIVILILLHIYNPGGLHEGWHDLSSVEEDVAVEPTPMTEDSTLLPCKRLEG